MFELWVPITIAAAFCQNARSALQKHLTGRLTTLGAAYVRFLYAWPFAVIYVVALDRWGGMAVPDPNRLFLVYAVLCGVAQIVFTGLLIRLFSFRNFAVGTTYSKTEVVLVAVLGFLILADGVTLAAAFAIAIAAAGVIVLSAGRTRITAAALVSGLAEKPTLIGLASGAFLGGSVVCYRGAALALGHDGVVMAAAYTLAVAVVIQTVIMGAYLSVKEPATLRDVFVQWRWSLAVGVAGARASACWVTAFTMQNAAYVRALGQIELVFTFAASVFFFREKTNRIEVVGIALVVAGILVLILVR